MDEKCQYFNLDPCFGERGQPQCPFAKDVPRSCDTQCEICEFGDCPCRRTEKRGGRSAYEEMMGWVPAPEVRVPALEVAQVPARQARKEKPVKDKLEGQCRYCGRTFEAKSLNKKFCSETCRSQAYFRAKKSKGDQGLQEQVPKVRPAPRPGLADAGPGDTGTGRGGTNPTIIRAFGLGAALGIGVCLALGVGAYLGGIAIVVAFGLGVAISVGVMRGLPILLERYGG